MFRSVSVCFHRRIWKHMTTQTQTQTQTQREEQVMDVLVRTTFGSKREEVVRERRKLHEEELHISSFTSYY
jgi:hypothetical protein